MEAWLLIEGRACFEFTSESLRVTWGKRPSVALAAVDSLGSDSDVWSRKKLIEQFPDSVGEWLFREQKLELPCRRVCHQWAVHFHDVTLKTPAAGRQGYLMGQLIILFNIAVAFENNLIARSLHTKGPWSGLLRASEAILWEGPGIPTYLDVPPCCLGTGTHVRKCRHILSCRIAHSCF